MHEQPRVPPETWQTQYERVLSESMTLHGEYQRLAEEVSALRDEGSDHDAEDLSRAQHVLDWRIDDLMKRRVHLLKHVEHVRTIEEVLPILRTEERESAAAMGAAEVERAFGGVPKGRETSASGSTIEKMHDRLSRDEWERFLIVRATLAREHGFTAKDVDPDSNWFTLTKDGIEYELKHFAFPSNLGIMGRSRISMFGVRRREGHFELLMSYDDGWVKPCANTEIQLDIDRIAAVFG
jgi:hypothetical protein